MVMHDDSLTKTQAETIRNKGRKKSISSSRVGPAGLERRNLDVKNLQY